MTEAGNGKMPYLEVKLGPDNLMMRFVGRIDYVLGRLPKADVQLRDMSVSRLHTQVFMDSRGNAFVRDLGSSGGTFVNDQQLRGTRRLKDGARVRIGQARLVFWDADPPVNAKDAPAKSDPKGLIRFNVRERYMAGNETVLAAERVAPTDENEPAEEPPEVKQEQFSDDAKPMQPSAAQPQVKTAGKSTTQQQAPVIPAPKKKRQTGIVPAPWEESWPPTSTDKRKQTAIPLKPSQANAPVPMPQRTGNTPRPAPLNMPVAKKPDAPLPPGALTEAPARLPSPRNMSGGPGTTAPPAPKVPSANLGPPPSQTEPKSETGRKRTISEEMMDEYSAPAAMPTVRLGSVPSAKALSGDNKPPKGHSGETRTAPGARIPDSDARPPRAPSGETKAAPASRPPSGETKAAPASRPPSAEIKAAPPKPASSEVKAAPPPPEQPVDDDHDLSTDEIAEYFGGQRKTGKLEAVDFGGKAPVEEDEPPKFGPGAKLDDDGDDALLEDSELDLGGDDAPQSPPADPRVITASPVAPPNTGKPPTKRLMIKKRELPGHEDLTVIAPKNQDPEGEAKTVYVAKPEGFPADSSRPRQKAEPQGPGGDTFHVPKEMAAELAKAEEARLRAKKAAADGADFDAAADALPDVKKARPADPASPGDTMTD
ncbi:MAG: FHA domain-containing protein [Planctomycetes bacterium]|nr:FHA domain-containing protein [Planctomycetota bacterium]